MDKLQSVPIVPISEDVNMVDSEGIGSNDQGDGSEDIAVQKVVSEACENVRKRGKGKLGHNFEELEVLSKRVKIESFGGNDVSIKLSASSEQVGPKVEFLDPIPVLLANPPISVRLRKAFEWLSLCKAQRDCKGSSGFSEETAENRVNLAESLVNAEILLELVRTRKELLMAKDSLRAMDDELKDAAVKHTMMARIGMMMESPEVKASWNIKEEIETFKLKFPDSSLEEYGVLGVVENPSVSK